MIFFNLPKDTTLLMRELVSEMWTMMTGRQCSVSTSVISLVLTLMLDSLRYWTGCWDAPSDQFTVSLSSIVDSVTIQVFKVLSFINHKKKNLDYDRIETYQVSNNLVQVKMRSCQRSITKSPRMIIRIKIIPKQSQTILLINSTSQILSSSQEWRISLVNSRYRK